MQAFELEYALIIDHILRRGEVRKTRNGETKSLFSCALTIYNTDNAIPLIQGRQMFPKGILGEFAAFVRGPKHIRDFEAFGCNYWQKWAKPDGSIELDYGNAWLQAGQIEHVVNCLNNNPYDRRMLITGWRPERLKELSLPCCHYAYQFYVRTVGSVKYLDILWHQRSTDVMLGLPSDIVLAYLWLVTLCKEVYPIAYKPGKIIMTLGDTHVYAAHYEQAKEYIARVRSNVLVSKPLFTFNAVEGTKVVDFDPTLCTISGYEHLGKLNLELLQ